MARKTVSSAGKFLGMNTVIGTDGTPYLTRLWFWRLRLHVFHRGDDDPDPHDHPFDFATFPLTSYVEEVVHVRRDAQPAGQEPRPTEYFRERRLVRAFRWHYRPAEHMHRVVGRWNGKVADPFGGEFRLATSNAANLASDRFRLGTNKEKIVTLVWFSKPRRRWGFLKNRDGKSCWVFWKDYLFEGGKEGPCQ